MSNFKERVAKGFSDKADNYLLLAETQKLIAKDLLDFAADYFLHKDHILDLGCGPGTIGSLLPKHDLIQIDIAKGMCDLASKNGHQTIIADMDDMPFVDSSFDVVFSSMVLQWSPDINKTFSEIKRILKNNGKICLSLLLDDSFSNVKEVSDLKMRFNNYFTQSDIDHLCKVHNLNIIKRIDKEYVEEKKKLITALQDIKNIGASTRVRNVDYPKRMANISSLRKLVNVNYNISFVVLSN